MFTNEEKLELVAGLVSTKEGRQKLIEVARAHGAFDGLREAIIRSMYNVATGAVVDDETWEKVKSDGA